MKIHLTFTILKLFQSKILLHSASKRTIIVKYNEKQINTEGMRNPVNIDVNVFG